MGIQQLKVPCIVGVHEYERTQVQTLLVDIQVQTDISKCGLSDRLVDALDYVSLGDLCQSIAVQGKYFLIEAYAYALIQRVVEQFSVTEVLIRISKPMALAQAEAAFVEVKWTGH